MQSVLSALHSPRRREILRLCWDHDVTAGDIHRGLADVTFGAVSQHLRILADAGLVRARRDGRHHYYRADQAAVGPLRPWLETMWSSALYRLQSLAEIEAARRGPRRRHPRGRKP